MVKELIHDIIFLGAPSEPADGNDLQTADDLTDTLIFHKEECVGMAANMIGIKKRIIAFYDESGKEPTYTVFFNPEIISKSEPYDTEEGCLSLLGGKRHCRRYGSIKVKFQNGKMQTRIKSYSGFTAEIIQHEIDHCNGILI